MDAREVRPAPQSKRGCVALDAEFGAMTFDAETRIASGRPTRRADLHRSHTATPRFRGHDLNAAETKRMIQLLLS